jgi:hypothetical protein
MATTRNPAWAEAIQLVPVLSLAFPFIVQGKVDLARAGSGFLIGGLLAVVVSAVVLRRRHPLNPILVGADLWLCLGAIAFNAPVRSLARWMTETQAFGLFVGALTAGLIATLFSSQGYLASPGCDARWVRRASLLLLALTVVVTGWAWVFRDNIRLGGGLPFIVLNAARRILSVRGRAVAAGEAGGAALG